MIVFLQEFYRIQIQMTTLEKFHNDTFNAYAHRKTLSLHPSEEFLDRKSYVSTNSQKKIATIKPYRYTDSNAKNNQLKIKIYQKQTQFQNPENSSLFSTQVCQLQTVNKIVQQFRQQFMELTTQFSRKFYQQKIQVSQLLEKLNENNKQIEKLKLKIQQLQKAKNKQNDLQSYLIQRVKDLQNRIRILQTAIHQSQRTQDKKKIDNIQKLIIRMHAYKLGNIKKLQNKIINDSQYRLTHIKQTVDNYFQNYVLTCRMIIQKCFASLKNLPKQSKNTDCFDPKFQDYNPITSSRISQKSFSEDFFFYPSSAKNSKIQDHINSILGIILDRNNQFPLNCFIDKAGNLKYGDSGTYVFDKKGNLIKPSKQQLQYLLANELIKLQVQKI